MQGRTYKYMEKTPLFPFGFGLGYGKLDWKAPVVNRSRIKGDQVLELTLPLENNSSFDLEEVVQVYLTLEVKDEDLPQASLIDFQRVSVGQGENRNVVFRIPGDKFSYFNMEGELVRYKGKAILTVANASPGQRSRALGADSYQVEVDIR